MNKIVVTKISEQQQFDHLGRSAPIIAVQFTVGDHGPFTETFDKATYDANTVRAKLQQFASSVQAVTGY